jgi:hypothetical protein
MNKAQPKIAKCPRMKTVLDTAQLTFAFDVRIARAEQISRNELREAIEKSRKKSPLKRKETVKDVFSIHRAIRSQMPMEN